MLALFAIGILAGLLLGAPGPRHRTRFNDVALGILGAISGGILAARQIGAPVLSPSSVIAAAIGAAVFVLLLNRIRDYVDRTIDSD